MPKKFMLLQNYEGGDCPLPMASWAPEEVEAISIFSVPCGARRRGGARGRIGVIGVGGRGYAGFGEAWTGTLDDW
jgi:hypothetical protein